MDAVNNNHVQIQIGTSVKTPTPIAVTAVEVINGSSHTPVPTAVVSISDEGSTLSFQESMKGKVIDFDEKPDEFYKVMSFEQLIDERDGQGKNRAEGDKNIYVMNTYGKAAQEAFARIRAQQMENTRNAESLGSALEKFRLKVGELMPEVSPSDIDVESKEGMLTVTGSRLTEIQKMQVQKLLDGPLAAAEFLKKATAQFNESGLKMINMMIYDEKGRFGGTNSEGKRVLHRDEPISMQEFTQSARYGDIAHSKGNYTWTRFYELVGSSNWGGGLVFEK